MEIREGLFYLKTHQWMKKENDEVLVGITDYAQSELRSVVFVNCPEVGDSVVAGESFAEVESVKVVSEVISPVSGIVSEVNEDLLDSPEQINESPYDAWLVRVKNVLETAELLTAEQYRNFLVSMGR